MRQLRASARMPEANIIVASGPFDTYVPDAPQADVNLFGILPDPDFAFMRRMVEATRSTCLFVRESGRESALA